MYRIKEPTGRTTTNLSLEELIHALNPVLRGWTNHHRHGASKRCFAYLSHYLWWRVVRWLRKKYPRLTWKQIRRRYWQRTWSGVNGARLAWPAEVAITRYRYRGSRIPSPWNGSHTHPNHQRAATAGARPAPQETDGACPVESRVPRNRHARFGGRPGKRASGNAGTAPQPDQPVDTVLPRRPYLHVFVCIGSRRIEYTACTSNPDGDWMLQQAHNLLIDLDHRGQRPRLLIHDRDTKFSRGFHAVFSSDGVKVIRTPVRAPNANAHIERWVGSVRRECLDRLLIFNRRQLERILRVYVRHYDTQRPHRALALQPPDPTARSTRGERLGSTTTIRHDLLGGLIHEYEAAAA
jgi:hypothetical protein